MGGDGATRAAAFIDRDLAGELEAGETIIGRAYLRRPPWSGTKRPAEPSIAKARLFGLLGIFVGFGGSGGPKISYLAALTDRRLFLIETRHGVRGPRPIRRHLFVFGRGDIRVQLRDDLMLIETRDGHNFRLGLDLDDKTTGDARPFFAALAAQAGVELPAADG